MLSAVSMHTAPPVMRAPSSSHPRSRRSRIACAAGASPAAESNRRRDHHRRDLDILTAKSEPLSYKLAPSTSSRSPHPDAVERRRRAERRKDKRRTIYSAISNGLKWWEVVRECSSNIVVATCSDDYYHAMRVARSEGRDVVVQFFSPKCAACKEEALHCARTAAENPDLLFIRVHHDKCKAVRDTQNITKLPWSQYFEGGDREAIVEGTRLATLSTDPSLRLKIPRSMAGAGALDEDEGAYCVVGTEDDAEIEEIANPLDTLLQAIRA